MILNAHWKNLDILECLENATLLTPSEEILTILKNFAEKCFRLVANFLNQETKLQMRRLQKLNKSLLVKKPMQVHGLVLQTEGVKVVINMKVIMDN